MNILKDLFGQPEKPTPKEFTFRGSTYLIPRGYVSDKDLLLLYFVYRAIDGDQLARDLLSATGSRLLDKDGEQVYPVEGQ